MQQLRGGLVPGKDEEAKRLPFGRLIFGDLAGLRVLIAQQAQGAVSLHGLDLGVGEDGDLGVLPGRVGGGGGTGKILAPDENGHVAGVFGEEDGFLRRGKAAAHHEDIPTGEKFSVTGGAVGHAPAPKCFLAGKAHHAGVGPGGPEDTEAGKIASVGLDGFDRVVQRKPRDLGQQELCPEGLGLLAHGFGQLPAAGVEDAGVIYHLVGDGDLAAETRFLFHDEHPIFGAGQIEPGGEPGGAAADDDHVIQLFGVHYSIPTRSRLGLRVSAPGCHLAGQTSSPCSWTNWQAWTFRSSSSALRPTLPALTS